MSSVEDARAALGQAYLAAGFAAIGGVKETIHAAYEAFMEAADAYARASKLEGRLEEHVAVCGESEPILINEGTDTEWSSWGRRCGKDGYLCPDAPVKEGTHDD